MLSKKVKAFFQCIGMTTVALLTFYGGITAFNNAESLLSSAGIVGLASAAPGTIESQSIMLQASNAMSSTVPPYLNYQGILRDIEGNLMNGEFDMTFNLYHSIADAPNAAKWGESVSGIVVRDGRFSILLGNSKPLTDTTIFATPNTYIGVTVGGFDEMMPRQRFASVPYAFKADSAAVLSAPDGDPKQAVMVTDEGEVGVGIDNPQASLHVRGQHGWADGSDLRIGSEQRYLGIGVATLDGGGAGNVHIRSGEGTGKIIFNAGEKDAFAIQKDGAVGVGTQYPDAQLHVNGEAIFEVAEGRVQISGPWGNPGIVGFSNNGTRRDIRFQDDEISLRSDVGVGGKLNVSGGTIISEGIQVGGEVQGKLRLRGEYHWIKGNDRIQMIPVAEGFCFLTFVSGEFNGGGERVEIIQDGGYWYLQGDSGAGNTLMGKAFCAG